MNDAWTRVNEAAQRVRRGASATARTALTAAAAHARRGAASARTKLTEQVRRAGTSAGPRFSAMASRVRRTAGSARVRVVTTVAVIAVLLSAGVAVGVGVAVNRVNRAIPQTDLFGSETPSADPSVDPTEPAETQPPPGADITGPLNILLAGHDMVNGDPDRPFPHSDAVLILHIDASLTHAYLTSLPRDLLVDIPANPPSGSGAYYSDKLTHSMTYGSRVPGSDQRDLAQGFALLARTVSGYTGIDHFDAGAVLSFSGLSRLVDAIGGIDVYVDTALTSIHMGPDGTDAVARGGPFQAYPLGRQHLNGWQALDYSRQRYGLSDGAYGRDRHIRQVVKAMVAKLFDFGPTWLPLVAPAAVDALGDMVTLDLRGRTVSEYLYALRNVRPEAITLVGLPGGSVFNSGGGYAGEALGPIRYSYFEAVRNDSVAEFLAANPNLVNADPAG